MIIVYAHRYAEGAIEALDTLCEGAEVLARYGRVMNIRTLAGRLIAIQMQHTPLSPFGVEIQALRDVAWPEPGAKCVLLGQLLRCGPLAVNLEYMRLAVRPNTPRPCSASAAAYSEALLKPYADQSIIQSHCATQSYAVSQQPLARPLRQLAALVHHNDTSSDKDINDIARLIGWGSGSTPSGDDFLIGFFGSWNRLSPGTPPPEWLLTKLASIALRKTTPLAAEFYVHLVKGRLSESIDDLLYAIGENDKGGTKAAADKLARFGASSGFDTMAGIRWYLRSTARLQCVEGAR